jgi:hypothetical protein
MRKKNLRINTDFTKNTEFEILENDEFHKTNHEDIIEIVDYEENHDDYDTVNQSQDIDEDTDDSDYDLDNYDHLILNNKYKISKHNKVHDIDDIKTVREQYSDMFKNKMVVIKFKKRSIIIHKHLHKHLYSITKRLSKHVKVFSCEIKDS